MNNWTIELVLGVIGTAGAAISASIRWGAGIVAGALRQNAEELRAHRAALVDNTHALRVRAEQAERPPRSGLMRKGGTAAGLLLLALLLLAGCGSVQRQTVRDLEFARQAWREDRAPDLEPEVIRARELFFATAIETARKGATHE
jgi:hypothetical protein